MRRLRFGRIIWVTATTLLGGGIVACSGVDTPDPGGLGGSSGSSGIAGSSGSGTGGSTANGGTSSGGSSNGGSSSGGTSNGGTSSGGSSSGGSSNNSGGTAGDEPDAGFEPDGGADPAPDGGASLTNLVANFDAEAVTVAPWIAGQAGEVAIATDQFRSGSQSVVTVGRDATWKGVGVDLFGVLEHGKVYDASVFVRTSAASTALGKLTARASCDGGNQYRSIHQTAVSETGWTEISGTLTMWTALECVNMTGLQLFVEQVDAALQIYVDDMVVIEQAP